MIKTKLLKLTDKLLDQWATDPSGPVALHLKQNLVSVEGMSNEGQIIYPPTYADVGYNVDTLADGTKVALIDSVGSQANRLEPLFKSTSGSPLADLVPQIDIVIRKEGCGECAECKKTKPKVDKCDDPWKERRSLLDLAHRASDAVVQSSPILLPKIQKAFSEMKKTGDAFQLCSIAPTSLLFGCWDSRGGSGEKRPRLVRSIIRAWDVDIIHSAAQFTSVWKTLDEQQKTALEKALPKGKKLSEKGFKDAPATKYKDGRRVLGGVFVRGNIERDITVNLVALRGLNGGEHTNEMKRYLLALALLTATSDCDLFLREGCNLRFADEVDDWQIVPRRGDNQSVDLSSTASLLRDYANAARKPFMEAWDQLEWNDAKDKEVTTDENGRLEVDFDLKAAKELLGQKTDEENEGE